MLKDGKLYGEEIQVHTMPGTFNGILQDVHEDYVILQDSITLKWHYVMIDEISGISFSDEVMQRVKE